jgi:hypothetical protein
LGLLEDILNGLRNFFESYILAPIRNIIDSVNSGIAWLKSAIPSQLAQIWNTLQGIAAQAANFILPKLEWLGSQLWQRLEGFKSFVLASIMPAIQRIAPSVQAAINNVANFITRIPQQVQSFIMPHVVNLSNWLRSFLPTMPLQMLQRLLPDLSWIKLQFPNLQAMFGNLYSLIVPRLEQLPNTFKTMLDGAFAGIADMLKIFQKLDFSPLVTEWTRQAQSIMSEFTALVASVSVARSIVTEEAALAKEKDFMPKALATCYGKDLAATAIEAVTLGQLDVNLANLMNSPDAEVIRSTYIDVQRMKIQMAFLKPLERYYNRYYLPNIPGVQDLITMVVREAFVPERVTPAPELFVKYMQLHGFAKEWADRYWTAHWVLIPLERATEMYWRGIMTEDFYKKYLVLHDYRPDEIDYILKWV